jgi:hypothetical protein
MGKWRPDVVDAGNELVSDYALVLRAISADEWKQKVWVCRERPYADVKRSGPT